MDPRIRQESLLPALIEALPDPIFIIDREGTYLQALGGRDRHHYDSGQYLIGKKMHDLLPKPKADIFLNTIRRAIKEQRLLITEYYLEPSDFTDNPQDGPEGVQWFEARVYPVNLEESEKAVVALVINITKRKNHEEELKRLSITDSLTGTNNRRFFVHSLEYELEQVKRYEKHSTLLLIDIDFFKKINDTHGHTCGDNAIIHIVRIIENCLRKSDIVGRIGGDELAVLLPNTNITNGLNTADKLVREVRHNHLKANHRDIPLTISIGCSEILPSDDTVQQFMSRADAMLYKAKNSGRDMAIADSSDQN